MRGITVFTPAYNRSKTLPRLYKSLVEQKRYLKQWLIVDDGSVDGTESLVQQWVKDKLIDIRYIKKPNGGMLSAHNVAYRNIDGGLCMCVDSDDFVANGALEKIDALTEYLYSREDLAGIVGLDIDMKGEVLGDEFPQGLELTKFKNIRFNLRLKGDKKYVYKKEVIAKFPEFPEFSGEKYPAASFLYRLIDGSYDLHVVNSALCVVEYQQDGNSNNKLKSYQLNPKSFKHYRLFCMDDAFDFKERFISAVHYVSSCLFDRSCKDVFFNKHFPVVVLALPLGVLLYIYIKNTKKTGFIKIASG